MTDLGGEVLVLTGLSGAGRSVAAATLEDIGWFVIDNLPATLFPKVMELAEAGGTEYERVAFVVGAGADRTEVLPAISRLRDDGQALHIAFLDASTDTLVRRYKDTRRKHPLSDGSLSDAIERERRQLQELKAEADLVIDTTDLNVHGLRDRISRSFGDAAAVGRLNTSVLSFGFKHGLPRDVDLVFDCRFLPNPHWVPELRPLTGLDADVSGYVLGQEIAQQFVARVDDLFEVLLPAYTGEGKAYLTIAFGCTGGHHRAVAIAEEVGRRLSERGYPPRIEHRDIER